jgi:hypothetical protein
MGRIQPSAVTHASFYCFLANAVFPPNASTAISIILNFFCQYTKSTALP